jgi:hypothetical protein
VECDFSGPGLKVAKEGNTPSISGSYGKGGPMIRINTDYGAIRILRASAQPPKPPSTPEPPQPPGKVQTTWNHRRPRFTHVARLQHVGRIPAGSSCVRGCAN